MTTARLFTTGGSQAVRLPRAFRFEGTEVFIRKEGDCVVLEPKRKRTWPRGFLRSIRITDPGFARPEQGALPPIPSLARRRK
jgi:antitoxin VapB